MKTQRLLLRHLAAAAVLAAAGTPAQDKVQDVLVTKTGRRIRGVEITAMTTSTIRYQQGETALEQPANLLLEVEWSEPPEAMVIGRAALANGRFQDAATAFAEAANAASRDVVKAECSFLEADALVRAAGSDQTKAAYAADKLGAWIAAHPDGFRLPDALLALGRAQVAAGQAEVAEQTFKKLADDSLAGNWGTIWGARGNFERARAQLARGALDDARRTFQTAMSSARTAAGTAAPGPELVAIEAEAAVGIGETMVRAGKFDDALAYYQGLAKDATSDAVRAAAKAGEGEALYLRAKDARNVTDLRAAQVALAEANLLDTTSGDATAKALYYSGLVLLALGTEHEASTFRQRALAYFDTVVREYASSTWASRAAEASRG